MVLFAWRSPGASYVGQEAGRFAIASGISSLGKTRLEKELQGLSLAPDVAPVTPGNTVLRGVPKGMEDRIREVILEITPDYKIARIQFEEADDSVTEYRFSEQKENGPVADQRFKFTAPPGVEVIEGEFGP